LTYISGVDADTHDHDHVGFNEGRDFAVPEDLASDFQVEPVAKF